MKNIANIHILVWGMLRKEEKIKKIHPFMYLFRYFVYYYKIIC